jgi:large subunit ribosomal protein L3
LQYWPRSRADKILPSLNWDAINSGRNLKGFIAYKAGMCSGWVKDETANSMTKGKKIAIPLTVLECPKMKILSIRFYKDRKVAKEILNENLDKELKRKLKLPKEKKIIKIDSIKLEDYSDLKIIVYSNVKKTEIKKKPDLSEIGLVGSISEKFAFAKEYLNKEISVEEIFEKGQLIDVRGVTKGKGFQGPVKRFGLGLKVHKTEKGQRRPGSLGPWHPARVTFRAPQAGQMGMNTRAIYNLKIIDLGKSKNNLNNIKNYGDVRTDYILVNGSIQGPSKRALLITQPLRTTKKQLKKNYELVELR